jgi:hypothetical protein
MSLSTIHSSNRPIRLQYLREITGHISYGHIKESIVVDLPAAFGPSPVFVGMVQARYYPGAREI